MSYALYHSYIPQLSNQSNSVNILSFSNIYFYILTCVYNFNFSKTAMVCS